MLMPFWIVSEQFQQQFLAGESHQAENVPISFFGQPRATIDFGLLMKNGIGIKNGSTISIELPDSAQKVFACTADGILSNAGILKNGKIQDGDEVFLLLLTVRGGWMKPACPWFETENQN